MKWLHLLLVGVCVSSFTACERHNSSELNVIQMEAEKQDAKNTQVKNSAQPASSDESKPAPKYIN